jgi:enoyl-CoA hydratase/carnithine racemase
MRKPIIGAINGPAASMGLAFDAAYDIRFAHEDTIFVNAFAQRSLSGEHASIWLLPRLMSHGRPIGIMWTGCGVSAAEAKECSLVNQIVPKNDLLETAKDYVRTIARTASPRSLIHIKQQTYRDLMPPIGPAMDDTENRTRQSMTRDDSPRAPPPSRSAASPTFRPSNSASPGLHRATTGAGATRVPRWPSP